MGHRWAEIGPAVRLKLRLAELILLVRVQLASSRLRESIEVETDLLLKPRVNKAADREVLFNRPRRIWRARSESRVPDWLNGLPS